MTDLWYEASEDHDAISRQGALSAAEGEMAPLWGFFFQASSGRELEHRLALGETRLFHVAARAGVEVADLEDMIRRRHALLREALQEGQDPVDPVVSATPSSGGGPEKPDEHREGPDFSHGYSEVPMGAPGGPVPQVTQPMFERPSQPSEATAARKCSCGKKLRNGKCKGCSKSSYKCDCTPAGASGDEDGPGPGGRTSARTAAGQSMSTLPAGAGGASSSPDGVSPGSMSTSASPAASPPAGTQTSSQGDLDLTPAQDVTASRRTARRDPVADHIRAVAFSVAASNPGLPDSECRRIARQVVSRYLRRADLSSSVMSDDPGGGSGGGGGGGGGGHAGDYMLGRQLINKLPGGGSGGAGAAGGAAELGEVAELAAL